LSFSSETVPRVREAHLSDDLRSRFADIAQKRGGQDQDARFHPEHP